MRIRFRTGTCSHMEYLIEWILKTHGPVLELGIGFGSTPILHELCKKRNLISYENDRYYYDGFRFFRSNMHELNFYSNLDDVPLERHWGFAFVDCAPTEKRRDAVIRLKEWADFIMVHDSEPTSDKAYHLKDVYPTFKHYLRYSERHPNTSIMSDKYLV